MEPMQQQGGLLAPAMEAGRMQQDSEVDQGAGIEGNDPEQDPGYVSAVDWVRDRMINGGGAQAVAKVVRAAGERVPIALGDLAYEVIDQADAQANPPMMEENVGPLAMFVLEEFWDVAAAAMGMEPEAVDPAAVFESFRHIIEKFVSEMGGADGPETQQLIQSLRAITPEQIREMMSSMDDAEGQATQPGAEQMPPQGAM